MVADELRQLVKSRIGILQRNGAMIYNINLNQNQKTDPEDAVWERVNECVRCIRLYRLKSYEKTDCDWGSGIAEPSTSTAVAASRRSVCVC